VLHWPYFEAEWRPSEKRFLPLCLERDGIGLSTKREVKTRESCPTYFARGKTVHPELERKLFDFKTERRTGGFGSPFSFRAARLCGTVKSRRHLPSSGKRAAGMICA
jgi:hypothetical protein